LCAADTGKCLPAIKQIHSENNPTAVSAHFKTWQLLIPKRKKSYKKVKPIEVAHYGDL
jgi:hypothetical protein